MVYCLGESERNCLLASRIYAQRYFERRHPPAQSFEKLRERFERTGNIQYEKDQRERTATHEENELFVALTVVENPHASTREISAALSISQSSASKTLRKHKYHPFHVQLVQALNENDFQMRLQFCEWALQMHLVDNTFLTVYYLAMRRHFTKMVMLIDIIFIIMR